MKTNIKTMMKNINTVVICLVLTVLSACVTQNYENDKNTPIVENEASRNDIAMTRISLALGYLKMGNSEQAKLNLEKAKKFAPKLIQVHTAFAHFYETVGEADLAINSYEQALSINNKDPDTLNNYGVFLCRQKRIDDAEEHILKAISIPSYILVAQSYENLANCQLNAQRYNKAELYFSKAMQHSPSRASVLLQMAVLNYIKADYRTAQHYITRYEKFTRKFSAHALALAYKIYAKQNNQGVAKSYAGMLVTMFPNSYERKQYILNGLAHIEADTLAQNYQLVRNKNKPTTKKKRVIVLSPSKAKVDLSAKATADDKSKIVIEEQGNKVASKLPAKKEKIINTLVAKSQNAEKPKGQPAMTLPVHIVSKGETLFSISKRYNIFMSSIKRWNRIKASEVLRIGDVIYLANPKKAVKH
jgi:type IV pilus assembly protein PilF